MARKPDDTPVTWGELRKIYKKIDDRIGECFQAIQEGDDSLGEIFDQHEDKIARLTRALNRLRKEVQDE